MHHMRLFLVVWFSPLLDLTIRFIAALILNSIHARGKVHMHTHTHTHTSLHACLSQMYLLLLLSSFIQHSASYKAGLTFVLKVTLLLKVALYNGLNIHFSPFCPPCWSYLQCPLKNLYFVLWLLFQIYHDVRLSYFQFLPTRALLLIFSSPFVHFLFWSVYTTLCANIVHY